MCVSKSKHMTVINILLVGKTGKTRYILKIQSRKGKSDSTTK